MNHKIDWKAIGHSISGIYSLHMDSNDKLSYAVKCLPNQGKDLVVVTSSNGKAIICHINDLPNEEEEDYRYVKEWKNRIVKSALHLEKDSLEKKKDALAKAIFELYCETNGIKLNEDGSLDPYQQQYFEKLGIKLPR